MGISASDDFSKRVTWSEFLNQRFWDEDGRSEKQKKCNTQDYVVKSKRKDCAAWLSLEILQIALDVWFQPHRSDIEKHLYTKRDDDFHTDSIFLEPIVHLRNSQDDISDVGRRRVTKGGNEYKMYPNCKEYIIRSFHRCVLFGLHSLHRSTPFLSLE